MLKQRNKKKWLFIDRSLSYETWENWLRFNESIEFKKSIIELTGVKEHGINQTPDWVLNLSVHVWSSVVTVNPFFY